MLLNDMHTDWDNEDDDTRPAIATLHTNGRGYWSRRAAPVQITELRLGYVSDEQDFGELCVHFNTLSWRPDRDGLIYTDKQFMKELQTWLRSQGLVVSDVYYSEQGMQGDNYVSCDVGKDFLASYKEKYPAEFQKATVAFAD